MDAFKSQHRPAPAAAVAGGRWLLGGAGLVLFHLAWLFQGDETGYWLPGLGVGFALLSWLGWGMLPFLAFDLLLVRWQTDASGGAPMVLADAMLHTSQIGLSWWLYYNLARGSRWLDDPRSATLFLILIPGGLSALAGTIQAFYLTAHGTVDTSLVILAAELWLSRMVGILVVAPLLIVTCMPLLVRYRLADIEVPPAFFGEREGAATLVGNRIELTGLTFAASVLALLLLWAHLQNNETKWMLWASCLVLIVWICIRQGLSGGCFAAGVTSGVVLIVVQAAHVPPEVRRGIQSGIQGNVLAFCSSALLVGVSASWIRANETRYRHVISRIPFVVYSARIPYGIPMYIPPEPGASRRDSQADLNVGPSISKLANVLLVSPACELVFGCEPATLIGPFDHWLEQIVAEDRELVIASLTQLCLQTQPVTCEYRLRSRDDKPVEDTTPQAAPARFTPVAAHRWMRDTLAAHYSEDGLVDGWDGLIEDITDQRVLSHNLRKTSNMLQVLITNLPTGVYFVQAPMGYPLLVNARARQLLGQREDLSGGLTTLSKAFRLHRPDGTEYPWEELPVSRALRQGIICRANDIVVHRADGRKVPLITWAAPIDLHNSGTPDAAVWVLEDWSAMHQAEHSPRESELRLRAVLEAMGEGLIVQDDAGIIIDCNAAACAILGIAREKLISRVAFAFGGECLREDGSVLPADEHPDRRALNTRQPARGVVIGLPIDGGIGVRWLLVNSMPLPVGVSVGLNPHQARVVTTFADITPHGTGQTSLRHSLDG